MNKPTTKQLTKSLIESILPQEIIYAEISAPGAMGNSGGIIMYIIVDGTLICFKTTYSLMMKKSMTRQRN